MGHRFYKGLTFTQSNLAGFTYDFRQGRIDSAYRQGQNIPLVFVEQDAAEKGSRLSTPVLLQLEKQGQRPEDWLTSWGQCQQ